MDLWSGFPPIDIDKSTATSGPIVHLIEVYRSADLIFLPALMDYTMSVIFSTLLDNGKHLSTEGVGYVYQFTPPKIAVEGLHGQASSRD
jgi:hypothetical protein